jgi:hypothetical protein
LPGLMYPLQLDANTRKYNAVGTLVINYGAMRLTGIACCVYHCFA